MEKFDVVVCGGGLAGLTLARQLKGAWPEMRLLVIEKEAGPLPEACHKVGESSVEIGADYYSRRLKLEAYFEERQLPKLGLRYFFGDQRGPLESRPEFGEARFSPDPAFLPTYQIDRGRFENDLRDLNARAGVELLQGAQVTGIRLAEGDAPHVVAYQASSGEARTALGRWVVDAAGRRRLLQSQLGLKAENGHRASAVWFRMAGRLDVDDMVPAERRQWHERVPGRQRYFSTNHLMGRGYWVWLIPLASGNTSVGIVADEDVHPFQTYGTYPAARDWIRRHEPRLDGLLGERPPLDFKRMKLFSYSSRQVFSEHRWACVGEAGVFSDPLYSPGSDFIALANTIVGRMIASERRGLLDSKEAAHYNRLFLALNALTTDCYRACYPIFDSAGVTTAKVAWDWSVYWGVTSQLYFQDLLGPEHAERVIPLVEAAAALSARVQGLFRAWAPRASRDGGFDFVVPTDLRWLRNLRLALRYPLPASRALEDLAWNVGLLERLAGVLADYARRDGVSSADFPARPADPSLDLAGELAPILGGRRAAA